MKPKIIMLLVIMLVLGCTDEVEPQIPMGIGCSQFDNSFYCSNGIAHINETIDAQCINYIGRVCYNKKFIIEDNSDNLTAHEVYTGDITVSDIMNLPPSYWDGIHLTNISEEEHTGKR